MLKEVLALDIDDVVVKHVEAFIKWSNTNYDTNLTADDYSEAWHEIWGVDAEEEEARKKLFFTDEIVGAFEIVEGAAEGITALSAVKKIIGVTSRRESLKPVTERVLDEVVPGVVDDVVFATQFRDGQKVTRPKADICLEIGATNLIDDQLKHCLAVSKVGVSAVLFGNNASGLVDELPENITRANIWSEVLDYFGVNPSSKPVRS